jgi:hypothetical protein
MNWARILAYVTGTMDQEPLANDGHQGRDISDNASGLEAGFARQIHRRVQASERHPAH